MRRDIELLPLRALLTPAWLGALAVLAVNDHFLKGSGLLPGVVTGKLSDFAGLFFAPALMGALLMVRSRRALVACHVAIGVVFSAIQLSADAAAGWSALMGLVGFPWTITRDPTDLIALPALFASWRMLTPHMLAEPSARGRSARANLRRSLQWGGATAGLAASVATSPPPQPWPEGTYEPFDAAVYLNNASEEEITVRLRELRTDVEADCFELSKRPGLIPDAAFGETLTWTMPPWTNIPAAGTLDAAECHAVMVDGDGLSSAILFWMDGEPPVRWVEGQTFEDGEHVSGAVVIEFDEDGVHEGYRAVGLDLVYERENEPPEYGPGCEPQSDGDRVDWSAPVPTGLRRIEAAEVGPDGCVSMDLATQAQIDVGESDRWYACIPTELWGPDVGSWIDISNVSGSQGAVWGDYEAVRLELRDADGLPPAQDKISMVLSKGQGAPDLAGLNLVVRSHSTCELGIDEACGTLTRNGFVQAWAPGSPEISLEPGDEAQEVQVDEGITVELGVMHAEERYLLDPACAEGSDSLGVDLELVAVIREAE
jgi:hypothetical protein